MMDRQSKEKGISSKELQEYLDKGGKITVCEPGARTENIEVKGGFYGRKKKKKEE